MDRYEPDVTTYSGIRRKYVNPIYPMTYKRVIEIINMPRLKEQLAEELQRSDDKHNVTNKNQLLLFK